MKQQKAGPGPPTESSSWSFKVSQAQGNLLPSQTCLFSAQGLGLGLGLGAVQSHQQASPLQLSSVGAPRLDLWIFSHPWWSLGRL